MRKRLGRDYFLQILDVVRVLLFVIVGSTVCVLGCVPTAPVHQIHHSIICCLERESVINMKYRNLG